jgi:hypothetical protein
MEKTLPRRRRRDKEVPGESGIGMSICAEFPLMLRSLRLIVPVALRQWNLCFDLLREVENRQQPVCVNRED